MTSVDTTPSVALFEEVTGFLFLRVQAAQDLAKSYLRSCVPAEEVEELMMDDEVVGLQAMSRKILEAPSSMQPIEGKYAAHLYLWATEVALGIDPFGEEHVDPLAGHFGGWCFAWHAVAVVYSCWVSTNGSWVEEVRARLNAIRDSFTPDRPESDFASSLRDFPLILSFFRSLLPL